LYLVFHLRPYFDQRGSKNKTILTRIKEKHATGINRTGTIWTAYGVENFSYIIQLYPIVGTGPDDQTKWATYLLFQLWNPHQNASSTSAVRFSCELTAELGYSPGGNGQVWSAGTADNILFPANCAVSEDLLR